MSFPKSYYSISEEDEKEAYQLALKNKHLFLRPNDANNLCFEDETAKILIFLVLPTLAFGYTIHLKHTGKKVSKRASSLKNAYLDACEKYAQYLIKHS